MEEREKHQPRLQRSRWLSKWFLRPGSLEVRPLSPNTWLSLRLDHVLAAAGLLGKRDGLDLLLRDAPVEHSCVRSFDDLREVEIAAVFHCGATRKEERHEESNTNTYRDVGRKCKLHDIGA